MKTPFLLSSEEHNKIKLSNFILELFNNFSSLYMLNISLHKKTSVEKGRVKKIEDMINITTSFKYTSFYCGCNNGQIQTCDKEEDLFKNKSYISQAVIKCIPINFYIKQMNKKIIYKDFEQNILETIYEYKEEFEFFFNESRIITFKKNEMQKNINDFLGKKILLKQNALMLDLEMSNTKAKYKKIKI